MKTWIVILTPDSAIAQSIGIKKTALIPSDLRSKYPNLAIASYEVKQGATAETIASYFQTTPTKTTGIVVLCDNRIAPLVAEFTTPLFVVLYDGTLGGKSFHNYFGMILSKTLKSFYSFCTRFDQGGHQKLIILPLRNFCAPELKRLHSLFRCGVHPDGNFQNSLDNILKELRLRQRPKVETNRNSTYVVDERDHYFIYGHEIHSKIETTVPPHNLFCGMAGNYRFGKRYNSERHFNVSVASGNICGTFENCHGESVERNARSHVNIFPNDFCGAN